MGRGKVERCLLVKSEEYIEGYHNLKAVCQDFESHYFALLRPTTIHSLLSMGPEIKAALISVIPATIVAVAALALSIRQALSESRKSTLADNRAQRELFEKFNERFNNLNEDLNAIREGEFSSYGRKTAQGVIQDYLNLCSEEYLWKKRGLIDDEIWGVWLDGINHYLQSPTIAEVFYREWQIAPNSYYGLFQHKSLQLQKRQVQAISTEV